MMSYEIVTGMDSEPEVNMLITGYNLFLNHEEEKKIKIEEF